MGGYIYLILTLTLIGGMALFINIIQRTHTRKRIEELKKELDEEDLSEEK